MTTHRRSSRSGRATPRLATRRLPPGRYHDHDAYETAATAALLDLDAFGQLPGKVAVFRETSAQHFGVPTGDYDEALAKDPTLVLASERAPTAAARSPTSRTERQWLGPSMCAKQAKDARSWRNEMVHDIISRHRLANVHVWPFEEITRERWDMHASTKWSSGRWVSDCTHLCYSQSFWDLSFHDLYVTLANSSEWLQRRHLRLTKPPGQLDEHAGREEASRRGPRRNISDRTPDDLDVLVGRRSSLSG